MERVQELIDKLYQQRLRNEAPYQLLPTVQQLYDALLVAAQKTYTPQTEKVAVVMPSKPRVPIRQVSEDGARPAVVVPPYGGQPPVAEVPPAPQPQAAPAPKEEPLPVPELKPVAEAPAPPAPQPEPEQQPAVTAPPRREEYILQKPAIAETPAPPPPPVVETPAPEPEPVPQPHLFGGTFEAADEAPTLQQQEPKQPPKEIHELIGAQQESLNDRLKQERIELAHVLKDTPIKDLRKAVGVNEKFQFVNELFRGDEAMYERSIKTINGFHIFPEAEYWINRELKVKLGWNESSQTVKHFYHLVRRRFS